MAVERSGARLGYGEAPVASQAAGMGMQAHVEVGCGAGEFTRRWHCKTSDSDKSELASEAA